MTRRGFLVGAPAIAIAPLIPAPVVARPFAGANLIGAVVSCASSSLMSGPKLVSVNLPVKSIDPATAAEVLIRNKDVILDLFRAAWPPKRR